MLNHQITQIHSTSDRDHCPVRRKESSQGVGEQGGGGGHMRSSGQKRQVTPGWGKGTVGMQALGGSTPSDGRWLGPVGNQEWTPFSPVAQLLNQVRELDWDIVSLSTRGGIFMLGSGSSLGQEVGQALCFSQLLVEVLS